MKIFVFSGNVILLLLNLTVAYFVNEFQLCKFHRGNSQLNAESAVIIEVKIGNHSQPYTQKAEVIDPKNLSRGHSG